jgi:hypothetical protein
LEGKSRQVICVEVEKLEDEQNHLGRRRWVERGRFRIDNIVQLLGIELEENKQMTRDEAVCHINLNQDKPKPDNATPSHGPRNRKIRRQTQQTREAINNTDKQKPQINQEFVPVDHFARVPVNHQSLRARRGIGTRLP